MIPGETRRDRAAQTQTHNADPVEKRILPSRAWVPGLVAGGQAGPLFGTDRNRHGFFNSVASRKEHTRAVARESRLK